MRGLSIVILTFFILLFTFCGDNPNPPVSSIPQSGAKNPHQEGATLFRMYCASCHNPHKDLTGPALIGSSARVPSKEWMYAWVKNPQALIDAKDAYALKIYEAWKPAVMTAFPNMTNEQIDAIMAYVEAQ
jgi:cytochrome c551/c552